jgi:hypothetical protein
MIIKLNLKPKNPSSVYFIELVRPSGMKTYIGSSLEEIWATDKSQLDLSQGFTNKDINIEAILDDIRRQGTLIDKYNIIEISRGEI